MSSLHDDEQTEVQHSDQARGTKKHVFGQAVVSQEEAQYEEADQSRLAFNAPERKVR